MALTSTQIGWMVAKTAIDFVREQKGHGDTNECLYWAQDVMRAARLPHDNLQENVNHWHKGSARNTALSMRQAGLTRQYPQDISPKDLKPGDMVFGLGGKVGHVGIYVGNGKVAQNHKGHICVDSLGNFQGGISLVSRPGGWVNEPGCRVQFSYPAQNADGKYKSKYHQAKTVRDPATEVARYNENAKFKAHQTGHAQRTM